MQNNQKTNKFFKKRLYLITNKTKTTINEQI